MQYFKSLSGGSFRTREIPPFNETTTRRERDDAHVAMNSNVYGSRYPRAILKAVATVDHMATAVRANRYALPWSFTSPKRCSRYNNDLI